MLRNILKAQRDTSDQLMVRMVIHFIIGAVLVIASIACIVLYCFSIIPVLTGTAQCVLMLGAICVYGDLVDDRLKMMRIDSDTEAFGKLWSKREMLATQDAEDFGGSELVTSPCADSATSIKERGNTTMQGCIPSVVEKSFLASI